MSMAHTLKSKLHVRIIRVKHTSQHGATRFCTSNRQGCTRGTRQSIPITPVRTIGTIAGSAMRSNPYRGRRHQTQTNARCKRSAVAESYCRESLSSRKRKRATDIITALPCSRTVRKGFATTAYSQQPGASPTSNKKNKERSSRESLLQQPIDKNRVLTLAPTLRRVTGTSKTE